jgi:hypothetical protein
VAFLGRPRDFELVEFSVDGLEGLPRLACSGLEAIAPDPQFGRSVFGRPDVRSQRLETRHVGIEHLDSFANHSREAVALVLNITQRHLRRPNP